MLVHALAHLHLPHPHHEVIIVQLPPASCVWLRGLLHHFWHGPSAGGAMGMFTSRLAC